MHHKRFFLIAILAPLVILLGGLGSLVYYSFKPRVITIGLEAPPRASQTGIIPQGATRIDLEARGGSLYLVWENLPEDAASITIFRSVPGAPLSEWRSISVPESARSGEAALGSIRELGGYEYRFAAENAEGQILWQSSSGSTPRTEGGMPAEGSQTPSPPPPSQSPVPPPSGATSSAAAPPPSSPAAPPPPPPPAATSSAYYTPTGEPVAPPPAITANFWVRHVNQRIELGWQNLTSHTERVVVSRASAENGPWTTLLTQSDPITSYYFVQLVDNTLYEARYYRLETYAGGAVAATYGPEFLEPLENP